MIELIEYLSADDEIESDQHTVAVKKRNSFIAQASTVHSWN